MNRITFLTCMLFSFFAGAENGSSVVGSALTNVADDLLVPAGKFTVDQEQMAVKDKTGVILTYDSVNATACELLQMDITAPTGFGRILGWKVNQNYIVKSTRDGKNCIRIQGVDGQDAKVSEFLKALVYL